MSAVDIIIILVIILFTLKGLANGVLKEGVTFIGGLAVLVISYFLKNPVSVFMYKHLPFFKFSGILSGISVLNVIIYELLAFLLVASILLIIYQLILRVTKILDLIVKITVVLEIPSKIFGAILGFVEGVIVTFVLLFILVQFEATKTYIDDSKYAEKILTSTPLLGDAIKPIYGSIKEIYEVADNYKDKTDKDAANQECLEILLKYKVLNAENARYLVDNGKLKIENANTIIKKYETTK